MQVLVVDVGGTNVKLMASDASQPRSFDSPPSLTPDLLVSRVRQATADWSYEVVSIGYPGRVAQKGPAEDPGNLGPGWVNFDFDAAFGMPRARWSMMPSMQALGGYDGGRMLFLGLGTGLGSALVTECVVVPLELGNLPDVSGGTLGDAIGAKGLESRGHREWAALVTQDGRRSASERSSLTTPWSVAATPTGSIRCRRTPAAAATRTRSKADFGYGRS